MGLLGDSHDLLCFGAWEQTTGLKQALYDHGILLGPDYGVSLHPFGNTTLQKLTSLQIFDVRIGLHHREIRSTTSKIRLSLYGFVQELCVLYPDSVHGINLPPLVRRIFPLL
jgi:hypothetical protein